MNSFSDLNITHLKKIARFYNSIIKIKTINKLSKEELINILNKHIYIKDNYIYTHSNKYEIPKLTKERKLKQKKVKKEKVEKVEEDNKENIKLFVEYIMDNYPIDSHNNPSVIQDAFNKKFLNKGIDNYYIKLINKTREPSLIKINNEIKDNYNISKLEYEIKEIKQFIKNKPLFKTKKAQENAKNRIIKAEKELGINIQKLNKLNEIKKIQKENYDILEKKEINTVKEANSFADLYYNSLYNTLSNLKGGDFSSAIQDFFAPVVHAFGQTTEVEEERKAKALDDADTARAKALVDKFKAMSKDDVENQLFKYKNAVDNASGTNRVIAVNALNKWMVVSVNKYPVYFSPEYFHDKGYISQSYLPYKNGKYQRFSDIGLSSLDKYLGSGRRVRFY
jgi:hypothetical protein